MNDKDKIYLQACLYAINKLTKTGSASYARKTDGEWHSTPWSEVCDWILEKLNTESQTSENTRAEDTAQLPSEDCISRKEVFETFGSVLGVWGRQALMEMKPVTPMRKKGKWLVLKDEYGDICEAICSCCEDNGNHKWKYCHTCGAEMEYGDEEQSETEK